MDLRRISVDHADHQPTVQTRVGCVILSVKAMSPCSVINVAKECVRQYAVKMPWVLYKIYYVYMKHLQRTKMMISLGIKKTVKHVQNHKSYMEKNMRASQNKLCIY